MKYIVILISLLFSITTFASVDDLNVLDEKVSDLSIEQEAEELDLYDEQALHKQTLKETKNLDRESKKLNRKITRLQGKQKHIKKTTSRLLERYEDSYAANSRASKKAVQAEADRNRLQKKLNRIQGKVNKIEAQAVAAKKRSRLAKRQVREMQREHNRLLVREKQARRVIKRNKTQAKKAEAKARKNRARNNKARNRVRKLERKAGTTLPPKRVQARSSHDDFGYEDSFGDDEF